MQKKTYKFDELNWEDTILKEKILSSTVWYFWETSDNWEKKYLHKIKTFDVEDFNFEWGIINAWMKIDKTTREWRIWCQSTSLSLCLEYSRERQEKMIAFQKVITAKFDIRDSWLEFEYDFYKSQWIDFSKIIASSWRIFRWIKFTKTIVPELVREIWVDKLLQTPAYKIEVLNHWGGFIQSTSCIEDYLDEKIRATKILELKNLNWYLFSIMPDDDFQDGISEKWQEDLFNKHITIDDLLDI